MPQGRKIHVYTVVTPQGSDRPSECSCGATPKVMLLNTELWRYRKQRSAPYFVRCGKCGKEGSRSGCYNHAVFLWDKFYSEKVA